MWLRQSDCVLLFITGMSPMNCIAGNKAGWEAWAVLICPGPPVTRRGTLQAPSQSLCLSLKVSLIPLQRGKEMQMCVDVFVCANACGWIVGALRLEPCISKGPMLIEPCAHCHSVSLSLTHTPLYTLSTLSSFWTSPGALPGPGFNICKVATHKRAHTHIMLSSLPLRRLCVPVFRQENRIV